MNYYAARAFLDTNGQKKYHYTCMNDGMIWAVGHCSKFMTCPECKGTMFRVAEGKCTTCDNEGVIRNPNPCPGHDTEEDACRHYRAYMLDRARLDGYDSNTQKKCQVEGCGKWTQKYALVDMDVVHLCEEHLNRDTLEKVYPDIGQIYSS